MRRYINFLAGFGLIFFFTAGLAFAKNYSVTKVIDGDTIRLEDNQLVRLIGIDAPESNHPEIPVQRFSVESKQFLENLIEKFPVRLEFESGAPQKDKYGRLLAYVYVGKTLVNAEIVKRGYAYALTRFPFKRMNEFIVYEEEARQKHYGLWNQSLTDGRIANIVEQYSKLSPQGKIKFDTVVEDLVKQYSQEKIAP